MTRWERSLRGGAQGVGAGPSGGPYAGGVGDVLRDTPHKRQRLLRPRPANSGPVEDLKVPRVREGDFHPRILPYRKRASLELSEIILALYAVGVSTRKISHFLEGIYGDFYSPQSISRLIQVTEEEVKAWRERPLSEEYYTVFFIVPHLLFKGDMVVSYLNFRKSSEPAS